MGADTAIARSGTGGASGKWKMLLNVPDDRGFQAYLDRMEQKLHVAKLPIIRTGMRLHLSRGSAFGQLHMHQRGTPVLLKHYKQIYGDMFDSIPARLEKQREGRSRRDQFMEDQLNYLQTEAAQRLAGISQSMTDDILDILMSGVREGLSVDKIGRDLYNNIDELSRGRAATIARTETHSAAMDAVWESLDSNENIDVVTKTWWTANDARVRPSHAAMHGVTVPVDEPFETDDGDCLYPGDDSLGLDAAGIVNCRCSVLYNT